MAETKEKLFQGFPPIPAQEWTDKIISDLKGASFEKKLVWKTGEGMDVNPFYTADDLDGMATTVPGDFPFIRGTKTCNSWLVRQDFTVDDCSCMNDKIKRLINEGGVTSIGFLLKRDCVSADKLALLLNGICPEKIELNFVVCKSKAVDFVGLLVNYLKSIHANLSECKGSVAYNPFKKPLVKGVPLDNTYVAEAVAVLKAGEALPNYRLLAVDASCFSDAGSSIAQESGYALAWGNELISKLSDAGLPVEKIAKKIKFNFGISSNYFFEIAKFRAVRWLWAEIVKAYQPVCDCQEGYCRDDGCTEDFCTCACKMVAHARTSTWNMTIYDAYVNLLRTQTEAMSAALVGVDSITVLPYDYAYKMPDEFSERIARNQQLLLKEECHLDKVTDPAAGSYYIETLTQSLADAIWKLFLEVENMGGFTDLVNNGDIQRAVNETDKSHKNSLTTRRQVLLGTNQYPNFNERVAEDILVKSSVRAEDNAVKSSKSSKCGCLEGSITKLNFSRGASEFEALRLATEKSGKTPKVFMLTIGNLAMRLIRSQFAANFFACAGYEIIDNLGFETVTEGIDAARAIHADIIVLCSSDDEYTTYAPQAYQLIDEHEHLIIAGAPACIEELKALGITNFISIKSNVLETLQVINYKLQITS